MTEEQKLTGRAKEKDIRLSCLDMSIRVVELQSRFMVDAIDDSKVIEIAERMYKFVAGAK